MHTLQAVITGAIQGLSEFLPISSSAHIVFSNELFELISGIKEVSNMNQRNLTNSASHHQKQLQISLSNSKNLQPFFL